MQSKKILLSMCLVLVLFSLIICSVRAETFTVPPFQEVTRSFGLKKGDKVSGSISVVGGTGNDVDFYVTDPQENTVLSYDRVTQTSFSFTASTTGTYVLHFDNSFSWISSKSVTLDYTIRQSIFGLSPEIFFVLIIFIIVAAAALIAAIGIRRRKPAS